MPDELGHLTHLLTDYRHTGSGTENKPFALSGSPEGVQLTQDILAVMASVENKTIYASINGGDVQKIEPNAISGILPALKEGLMGLIQRGHEALSREVEALLDQGKWSQSYPALNAELAAAHKTKFESKKAAGVLARNQEAQAGLQASVKEQLRLLTGKKDNIAPTKPTISEPTKEQPTGEVPTQFSGGSSGGK